MDWKSVTQAAESVREAVGHAKFGTVNLLSTATSSTSRILGQAAQGTGSFIGESVSVVNDTLTHAATGTVKLATTTTSSIMASIGHTATTTANMAKEGVGDVLSGGTEVVVKSGFWILGKLLEGTGNGIKHSVPGGGWALLGVGILVLALLSAFNIYSILKMRPRIILEYKQDSNQNYTND